MAVIARTFVRVVIRVTRLALFHNRKLALYAVQRC